MLLFGFIYLAIFLVLGGGSTAGLIYIWIRACKQPKVNSGMAQCGRCGYIVHGASTMSCSECGADFREVGIASPSMQKGFIHPAVFIALWTICLLLPGCFISSIFVAVGPTNQIPIEDVDLYPPDTNAAGYDNVMLSRTPYGMYSDFTLDFFPSQSRYVDVDIYGPNGNEWNELDLVNFTYEDYMGMNSNPQPFDRAKLESWIGTVGGDLKNPDVQKQIDQIYTNLQQTQSNGMTGSNNWSEFTVSSQNSYTEDQPAVWFIALQFVIWLLVYVGGIVLYLYLKRRYDMAVTLMRDQQIAAQHAAEHAAEQAPA